MTSPTTFPHEPPVPAEQAGVHPGRLARVIERFRAQHADGRFHGGQLAVRRRGLAVACEAVGQARRAGDTAASLATSIDTPFPVFSAGKPVVALAVAMLEDRGQLDVQTPIARYWPDFAQHDKGDITALDVLTHRGGVLMPALCDAHETWPDWDHVRAAMEATRPSLPRGTLAYHPLEYGWILAELVQRVTGEPFADWVGREIAEPTGLPALAFGAAGRDPAGFAHSYWLNTRPVYVAGRDVGAGFEEIYNSDGFYRALVPGGGLICDAASLCALYDVFRTGAAASGARLLSADRMSAYTRCEVFGWDRSNKAPLAVGRGFLLGTTAMPSPYGWWNTAPCFGHPGGMCTVAFADPRLDLSVAIVTNGNRDRADLVRRFAALGHGLRRACLRG